LTHVHLNVLTSSLETLKDQNQTDIDHHDHVVDLLLTHKQLPQIEKPKAKPVVKPVVKHGVKPFVEYH
jgi:hypothetical protein